jgi:hypothetical protein
VVAKTSGRKRGAFLRAFARTGNVTLAAERAGVSRSWVSMTRRADPAFDTECRAAKAASGERLRRGAGNRPPPGWARQGRTDLMVTRGGKVIRSAGPWQWTPRAEARFLGQLGRCANLRLACAWAGMTLSSLEAHLRRWPDFRRRVDETLAFGRLRLEAELEAEHERAIEWPETVEPEPVQSIDALIRLVRRHIRRKGG